MSAARGAGAKASRGSCVVEQQDGSRLGMAESVQWGQSLPPPWDRAGTGHVPLAQVAMACPFKVCTRIFSPLL